MSYHLYTTEGFILRSVPHGEADREFSILTRELGLISASAKSVRSEKTKLGGGLQDFSLSELSLIRGKQRWKVTSAVCLFNMFALLRDSKQKLTACARTFKLIEKLVAGEEVHAHFFDVVNTAVGFLKKTDLSEEEITLWETVFVLRILFNLGYSSQKEALAVLFDDVLWNTEVLLSAAQHKRTIIKDINESLLATQLS